MLLPKVAEPSQGQITPGKLCHVLPSSYMVLNLLPQGPQAGFGLEGTNSPAAYLLLAG